MSDEPDNHYHPHHHHHYQDHQKCYLRNSDDEGSAVDDISFRTKEDAFLENQTEVKSFISTNKMASPNSDRRGSDDSYGRRMSPNDGRGSEDSLVGEGISLEKQDVEKKEKSGKKKGGDEDNGKGEEGALPSLQTRVITPVELEMGQVIYVPSAPLSTSMPQRRPRPSDRRGSPEENGRRDEGEVDEGEASDSQRGAIELQGEDVTQQPTDDIIKDEVKDKEEEEVIEEVTSDVFFDAYHETPRSGRRERDDDETQAKNLDDDRVEEGEEEEERIRSVSDGDADEEGEDEEEEEGVDPQWYRDDTFPLRMYRHNVMNNFSKYGNLTKRPHNWDPENDSTTGSGFNYQDDDNSVVSDIFSPRPESKRVAASMARFRSKMPKFSTRANDFKTKGSPTHAPQPPPIVVSSPPDDDEQLQLQTVIGLESMSPGYFLDDYSDVTPRVKNGHVEPKVRTNPTTPRTRIFSSIV